MRFGRRLWLGLWYGHFGPPLVFRMAADRRLRPTSVRHRRLPRITRVTAVRACHTVL